MWKRIREVWKGEVSVERKERVRIRRKGGLMWMLSRY